MTLYEPSDEAMSWPSGAKIATVQQGRGRRNGDAQMTLAGMPLIYAFLFVPERRGHAGLLPRVSRPA